MLNRKGADRRQRGSMILMVIFVMILFSFLAASLVRFSVDQNTGYYGWNAEIADANGYKDCDRIKNIDPDGFRKGSDRKFVGFRDKFPLPDGSGLESCSFSLECRKGEAAGSGVYYLTAIGRCGRDGDYASRTLSGYAANGNWHGEGR